MDTPEDAVERLLGSGESYRIGDSQGLEGSPIPDEQFVQAFVSALLQSDHLSLLVGAGFSRALVAAAADAVRDSSVSGPLVAATASPPTETAMAAAIETGHKGIDDAIQGHATEVAKISGRGAPNLEDFLSTAITVARGLEIVNDARAKDVSAAVQSAVSRLVGSVVADEARIAESAATESNRPILLGGAFLATFASRLPTRDRLHVFTTNYDRVIEWAADQVGLRVLDRFVGALRPTFRSSRLEIDYHYSPPGPLRDPRHLDGVVRLTKLHGSLDWVWAGDVHRLPSEFGSAVNAGADALLVYPQAAKDFETTYYPYAELFRDFAAATCRPESVLITYGYSFGDSHINRVIRDMLTVPSTHLLIISRTDDDGRARRFADSCHPRQVSLLIGPVFGELGNLVERWLPWPTLSGITARQAEALRLSTASTGDSDDASGRS